MSGNQVSVRMVLVTFQFRCSRKTSRISRDLHRIVHSGGSYVFVPSTTDENLRPFPRDLSIKL